MRSGTTKRAELMSVCYKKTVAAVLLAVACGSCDEDGAVKPPMDGTSQAFAQIDVWPAWSPNDSLVAFARTVESSLGPPGIYIVGSHGGASAELVAAGHGASHLRFSPSGLQLSFTAGLELHLLDLRAREVRQLTNTGGNAQMADWSPDGDSVVFFSPFILANRQPSLHILTLADGNTIGFHNNGEPISGRRPRWSPDGDLIAYEYVSVTGDHEIRTVRPDGSNLRQLTRAASNGWLASDPRWLDDGQRILFRYTLRRNSLVSCSRVVSRTGSDAHDWPAFIGPFDAISHDSRLLVTAAPLDDTTRVAGLPVWTLFTKELDDAGSSTLEQLTFYEAPP